MDILEYIKTNLVGQGITDIRPGTVVRDLLIKPHILLMDPLLQEIDRVRLSQSLKNYALMSNDEMDLGVGNLLLDRKQGLKASGTMRFQFTKPTSATIPYGAVVYSDDNIIYNASSEVSMTAQNMQYNIDGIFYYMDVPVEAYDQGPDSNVTELNSIFKTTISFSTLARIENITAISGGVSEETNEELYIASKRAIGERTLLRDDGSFTILTRAFPEILRMDIVGTGDPEMLRDIFLGQHMGGLVDHYIDTSSKAYASKVFLNIPATINIKKAAEGDDPTYMIVDTPVLAISEIRVIDSVTYEPTIYSLAEGVDYTVTVNSNKIEENYSVYQEMTITIGTPHVGTAIQIFYVFNPTISDVQDYVLSIDNRVSNANHVIYNLLPAWLDITFNYRGTGTEVQVLAALSSYILDNKLLETAWESTDMVSHLYDTGLVSYIEKPYSVAVRVATKEVAGVSEVIDSEHAINYLNIYYPGDINVSKIT